MADEAFDAPREIRGLDVGQYLQIIQPPRLATKTLIFTVFFKPATNQDFDLRASPFSLSLVLDILASQENPEREWEVK